MVRTKQTKRKASEGPVNVEPIDLVVLDESSESDAPILEDVPDKIPTEADEPAVDIAGTYARLVG